MKNIFISGGSGFLGRFLVEALKKKKVFAPKSKDCNLFNYKDLKKFNKIRFDEIYHLAAWTQAGDFCLKYPGDQWKNNQIINTNMISWWQEFQPQAKLSIIGTSCSYDPKIKLIEANYMIGEPIESLYTYAMTKRMLLTGVKAISKQYKLSWNCFVPSTLYGPYYHTDGRQMHFIFDLIFKILKGKYYNSEVVLWGNGNQRREILHVNDFVKNMIILNNKTKNKIFNIGAGQEFSIKEFAKKICRIVDYDFKKIKFDKSKYVGAKSKNLNISKVKKEITNYSAKLVDIDKGLSSTIKWVKKNLI